MSGKGYKVIHMPDHPKANNKGWVYEHYIVAEQKLGRYLQDKETVHHIDGNKKNNNPDNLIVFATYGDHTGYHMGCEIYENNGLWYAKTRQKEIRKCPNCKNEFTPIYKEQQYCSLLCSTTARRTMKNSLQEIQQALFKNNGNFVKTAKQFNVTANCLVKRLKTNNLPYHSKDYR